MGQADDILAAAERLYAAAAAPGQWPAGLAAIVDLVGADHAVLVGQSDRRGPLVASARVDERDLARLFSADGIRLMAPMFGAVPIGSNARSTFVSDADWARSTAYNELIRPMNGFHGLHARGDGFMLNICRPQRADNFDAADLAVLRALAPHLGIVVELHGRLQTAEHGYAGIVRVLDRLDAGVILTDGSGRLVMLNARAERIIAEADGLSVDAAGLAAATPAATRNLRDAIAAMASDTAIEAQRIRLERPSHRLPLLLTALPIWRLGAAVPGVGAARVAVFITEPDAPVPIDRTTIAETFRLTRRESEIAVLLADGFGIGTIASRLGLGRGTVRDHLRHIFQKTGAHSQPALVALLRGFVDRLR